MNLSANFTLEELTRSTYALRHGITNIPPEALIENGKILAAGLERIRSCLNVPIYVESGYRNNILNVRVGGSINPPSQHVEFLAADIVPMHTDLRCAAKKILDNASFIKYDQLILEGTWIHVSFSTTEPRGDVYTAVFGSGRPTYTKGLA